MEIDAFQTNAAQKDGSPMEIDDPDNNPSLMQRETQINSTFWKLVHVLCICIKCASLAPERHHQATSEVEPGQLGVFRASTKAGSTRFREYGAMVT